MEEWVASMEAEQVFTAEALLAATAMSQDATADFVVAIAARHMVRAAVMVGVEAGVDQQAGVGAGVMVGAAAIGAILVTAGDGA